MVDGALQLFCGGRPHTGCVLPIHTERMRGSLTLWKECGPAMHTAAAETASAAWIPVAAAVIAAIAAIFAQLVTRLGEPRRLRMLKLLNELITGYEPKDDGEKELVAARRALAHRAAAALLSPPYWIRALGLSQWVIFFLASWFLGAALAALDSEPFPSSWAIAAFTTGGVWVLVWVARSYAEEKWQERQTRSTLAAGQ